MPVGATFFVGAGLLSLLLTLAGVALLAHLDGGRRLRDVGWHLGRRSLPLLGLGMVVSAVVIVAVAGPLAAAGCSVPVTRAAPAIRCGSSW